MPNNKYNKLITIFFLMMFIIGISSCAHKSGHHGKDSTIHKKENEYNSKRRESKVGGHTKIIMKKDCGVYLIPIIVNGLNLDFIFDTGASNISISAAEATVMVRQGKITDDDIIGKAQITDANGDISVGTVILLRRVQIGDIVLENVEATVVDNSQAPLLLGQTALAKFGKVTIDYNNNTIEFN